MSCPRDLAEMKQLAGLDDAVLYVSDEGGVWADGVDVNRLLLHNGLPGLESLGGRANVDEIGDRCPKDDVDLIVIEGGEHWDLVYCVCEVCGGLFIELGVEPNLNADEIEEEIVAFFKDFHRPVGKLARK